MSFLFPDIVLCGHGHSVAKKDSLDEFLWIKPRGLVGLKAKTKQVFSLFQIYTNTNNCIERGQLSCNASQEGKQPENVCSGAPFYALRHVCGVPSFLLSAAR